MRVIFKKATGEIVTIGKSNRQITEELGFIDANVMGLMNPLDYVVDHGVIREKTASEKKTDSDKIVTAKNERFGRKKAIMQKLGLNKSDLTALIELLEDRTDE